MNKYVIFKKVILSVATLAVICFELLKYIFSVQFIVAASCMEIILAAIAVFCIFSKEKSIKTASVILIAFSVITFIPNIIIGFNRVDAAAEPQYVIHAGGRDKGEKNYLNCEEQFERYLSEGQNLIEVDFMLTSDKRVICTHWFEHTPYSKKNRPTFDEFMSRKIGDKYSATSFERLVEILLEYPEARIVFDTKESDSIEIISVMCGVAENMGLDIYSRFIIQVYGIGDYDAVKEAFPQFKEYWFTNYKASYPFAKMIKLFKDKADVTTFVICKESWCCYSVCFLKTDKKIAVHTENSTVNCKFYCERGVDYVYADYVYN